MTDGEAVDFTRMLALLDDVYVNGVGCDAEFGSLQLKLISQLNRFTMF